MSSVSFDNGSSDSVIYGDTQMCPGKIQMNQMTDRTPFVFAV